MKTMGTRAAGIGVAGLVGLLVGIGMHSAYSQGARPVPAASDVGRYQVVIAGTHNPLLIYFIDTKTGRCWERNFPSNDWYASSPLDRPNR